MWWFSCFSNSLYAVHEARVNGSMNNAFEQYTHAYSFVKNVLCVFWGGLLSVGDVSADFGGVLSSSWSELLLECVWVECEGTSGWVGYPRLEVLVLIGW